MRPVALAFLLAASLRAAIDGTVVNRTTGKPQPGVAITLIKPGQRGMRTLGTTVSDASGHFVFEKDEPGGGPQLLQANYKGVNYNKLMTPNVPTSNVELEVFESSKSPAVARIAQQMLVLEPNSSQIAVSETVLMENDSNTTFNNPETGELLLYLPPSANGQVRVNAQGPQGMPLPRPAEKTKQTDVFKVDFPIKPGQSEFEVSYVIPAGSPFTFHGRVVGLKGMQSGPLRLIAPPGVTLSGNDIQSIGTEPKTQATIYNVTVPGNFSFNIMGTGSLRQQDTGSEDDSDRPQVTQANPPIYAHMGWLLTFAFGILGVGILILFRNSPVRSPYGK
jgi:hypothetical protein